jgi:hypothetical protein
MDRTRRTRVLERARRRTCQQRPRQSHGLQLEEEDGLQVQMLLKGEHVDERTMLSLGIIGIRKPVEKGQRTYQTTLPPPSPSASASRAAWLRTVRLQMSFLTTSEALHVAHISWLMFSGQRRQAMKAHVFIHGFPRAPWRLVALPRL